MVKDYWQIVGIEVTTNDQTQLRTYWGVFEGPQGVLRIPISVEGMLEYYTFQRETLTLAGFICIIDRCEGRDIPSANMRWKELTDSFLRGWYASQQSLRAQQQAQGGAMMN